MNIRSFFVCLVTLPRLAVLGLVLGAADHGGMVVHQAAAMIPCLWCASLEDDDDDADQDDDGGDSCNPPAANDGPQGDSQDCPPPESADASNAGDDGAGMPLWRVSEPFINLWIQDTPLRYRTSSGRWMELKLSFKQRSSTNDQAIAGFGTNWGCNWIGYHVVDDSVPNTIMNHRAGGGVRPEKLKQAVIYELLTGRQLFVVDTQEGHGLRVLSPLQAWSEYLFGQSRLAGITNYLLTHRFDQYGRTMQYQWDNYNTGTSIVARLVKVIDRDGRTNTLGYTNGSFPSLITSVADPYGRTAYFSYDQAGRLTNIVDIKGMASSLAYDQSGLVTNLHTLYGDTGFRSFGSAAGATPINRAIEITEADGSSKQLYAFRDCGTNTTGSIGTNYYCGDNSQALHNSFHWNRAQYATLSEASKADYLDMPMTNYWQASVKHWLFKQGGQVLSDAPGSEAGPVQYAAENAPRARPVYFEYQDQVDNHLGDLKRLTKIVWNGTNYATGVSPAIEIGRNSWGRPTSISYWYNGQAVTYTHQFNADGRRLERVWGPPGNVMVRGYGYHNTITNLLTSVTNAANEVINYFHDTATMKVVRLDFPGGLTRSNIYYSSGTSTGFLQQAVDVGFKTNGYSYLKGNVQYRTNELGLVTTNAWDDLSRPLGVFYPDGSSNSIVWDKLDVSAVRDRVNNWSYYVHDPLRRLTWVTNANGQVTQRQYCGCGSVTSVKQWSGANFLETKYNFDLAGNLTNAAYADNYQVNYSYDELQRLVGAVDSGNRQVTFGYNDYSQLSKIQVGPYGSQKVWAVWDYDGQGRLTSETDRNGVSTGYQYDNVDRLTQKWVTGAGTNKWVYTSRGVTNAVDPLGYTNWYVLDPLGRLLYQTNANTERLSFTYRPDGQMETFSDGKQQITSWKYNLYGLLTNKVDAAANEILRYAYDCNGRLTNRWTAEKGDTVFRYDPLGNLTNVDYPGTLQDIQMGYDAYNRLTSVADAVGMTVFSWTDGGLLASEEGPWAADKVSYGYSNRDRNSLNLAQPNAPDWSQSYAYDELGRLTNVLSPAGAFGTQYKSVTTGNGPMAAGLVSKVNLPGGSAIHNLQDDMGRLLSTALVTAQQTTNNLHAYIYNYGDQRTKQTFKDGNFVDYTYDNIGQLKTAFGKEVGGSSRLHEQFGYAYDGAWNLNWRTNNQLKQQFQVDSLNQLSSGSRSGTLTVAGSVTIPSSTVTVSGTGLSATNATVYADGAWVIAGASLTNGLNNYSSTATSGSRTAQDTVSVNLPASPSFLYDRNGNLTNDGVRTLEFDFENQLTNVFVTNGWRSQFSYDGLGRRRMRREYKWQGGAWVPTNEVHYVYDGMLVLQERDGNNLPQITYTRGNDLSGSLQGAGGIGGLLARTDNGLLIAGNPGAHAYYHADGNGNVTCLASTNGIVVARYSYDPYGNLLGMSGPLADVNLYRFSSKERHPSSGLYYYGFRFYDPSTQRWLSRDPLEEEGGINLYGFVFNDPVDFADPDGLWGIQFGGVNIGWGDPNYVFDGGTQWRGYFGDVGDTALGELKGVGSELSLGIYKPCYTSALQKQGGYVGIAAAMAGESVVGWGAAGKAVKWSGKEFSHAIPARALPGGRGGALDKLLTKTKLNGNHVPIREHALSDLSRYKPMPRAWKDANPLPNAFRRTLNRVPRFPLGMGAAAAGGYAASQNDGGCQ